MAELTDFNLVDLLKWIIGIGGGGAFFIHGLGAFAKRLIDNFEAQNMTLYNVQKERGDKLEKKLDDCEKKHDDAQGNIMQLQKDTGILMGKVQTLETLTAIKKEFPKP